MNSITENVYFCSHCHKAAVDSKTTLKCVSCNSDMEKAGVIETATVGDGTESKNSN